MLEDGLADEQQFIEDLQANHTLPLNLKSVSCQNISQEDIDNVTISIEQIKSDLKELDDAIIDLEQSTNSS